MSKDVSLYVVDSTDCVITNTVSKAVVVVLDVLNSVPSPASVWNIVLVFLDVPKLVKASVCLEVLTTV